MQKRNASNCLRVMICIFFYKYYQNKYNFLVAFGYVTDSFEDDFLTLMKHTTVNTDFKWSTGMVRIYLSAKQYI